MKEKKNINRGSPSDQGAPPLMTSSSGSHNKKRKEAYNTFEEYCKQNKMSPEQAIFNLLNKL